MRSFRGDEIEGRWSTIASSSPSRRNETPCRLINSAWIQPPCLPLPADFLFFRSTLSFLLLLHHLGGRNYLSFAGFRVLSISKRRPPPLLSLLLLNFLTAYHAAEQQMARVRRGWNKSAAFFLASPTGNLTWRKSMNPVKIRSSGGGVSSFWRIN